MNFPEAADIADGNGADAVERKIVHGEVSLRFREIAQIAQAGLFSIRLQLGVANYCHTPLGLDMRVALVMGDQADARVVPDVFGVFGEGADKDEQAAIVIHQVRRDRAERITIEFFRQGA